MTNTTRIAGAASGPQIPDGPLLSQLAGMPEARAWAEGLVQDLSLYRAGRLNWSDIDAGCVLHGPPGTGKTTLARALAATSRIPLIASSYAEWTRGGRYGIDVINAMRAAFESARKHAPCIIAIDEIDSMPARASLSPEHLSTHMIVNALLEQLDGLNKRPGVVVIGTCNHPDRLDEALVRSGRLGRSIRIPLPNLEALPQIIKFHLAADAARIGDLSNIAVMCVGMSGADIEQLARDARQNARRASRPLDRRDIIAILEARSRTRSAEAEWRIAVHEAGHAVADLRLGISSDISISIVGTADLGGRVTTRSANPVQTRKSIEDRLVCLLAGRAAEEALLGSISGGAGGETGSDLAQATRIAFQAIGALGLSSQNTLLWYGRGDIDTMRFHPSLLVEAKEMLNEAYANAVALVRSNTVFVERVATQLVKRRALTHHDIQELDPESLPSIATLTSGLVEALTWKRSPAHRSAVSSHALLAALRKQD